MKKCHCKINAFFAWDRKMFMMNDHEGLVLCHEYLVDFEEIAQ